MLGVSMHRGLERPLHGSVKVKPGLPWRLKDVGDAIVLGYLLKKPNTGFNRPKEKKYIVVNKAERTWRSEECFGIRDEDAEFGVCPACFQSSFAPHFCTMFSLYPLEG